MFRRFTLIAFLTVIATMANASMLVADGASEDTIFLSATATESEKNAAAELVKYLKLATGIDFPVTDKFTGAKQILVGVSPEAERLLPDVNWAALGHDAIVIGRAGDNLVLAGERPRGTLYAVYDFLETELGVRFWTPTEETVPACRDIALPDGVRVEVPAVDIRMPYVRALRDDPVFAAKSRCYGPHYVDDPKWGGRVDLIGPWHTFDRFLPADEYLTAHPEYFSLRHGQRVGGQFKGQLCLSNPALREKFLAVVLDQLRHHPDPKFISVSQNDNDNFCECPDCQKIDQAGGVPSASLLTFVNGIAEAVEKEFPGVLVQTFAYQYSRTPPAGIRPRANVSMLLCAIEADFSKPLTDPASPANAAFLRDLEAWNAICNRIDLWYYVANFNNFLLPHPNLDALKQDIAYLAARHPHMMMLECDSANLNMIDDLLPLKIWIAAKLLWNPGCDTDALENEFVEGYYGAAAPHLKQYLALRRAAAAACREPVGCFEFTAAWVTPELLSAGLKQLDAARDAVAGDPVLSRRVALVAKPFEYLLITEYPRFQAAPGCPAYPEAIKRAEEYLRFLDEYAVTNSSSTDGVQAVRERIKRFIQYPPKAPLLPEFFAGLQGRDYTIFEEDAFVIYGDDQYAEIVRDDKSANGWAIMLKHDGPSWAVKLPFRPEMDPDAEYEIYAACRLDQPARQGLFLFGGYDLIAREQYITEQPDADGVACDRYTYVPLGTYRLRKSSYLFFDPKTNPAIARSYIDHLVLVRKAAPGADKK